MKVADIHIQPSYAFTQIMNVHEEMVYALKFLKEYSLDIDLDEPLVANIQFVLELHCKDWEGLDDFILTRMVKDGFEKTLQLLENRLDSEDEEALRKQWLEIYNYFSIDIWQPIGWFIDADKVAKRHTKEAVIELLLQHFIFLKFTPVNNDKKQAELLKNVVSKLMLANVQAIANILMHPSKEADPQEVKSNVADFCLQHAKEVYESENEEIYSILAKEIVSLYNVK